MPTTNGVVHSRLNVAIAFLLHAEQGIALSKGIGETSISSPAEIMGQVTCAQELLKGITYDLILDCVAEQACEDEEA